MWKRDRDVVYMGSGAYKHFILTGSKETVEAAFASRLHKGGNSKRQYQQLDSPRSRFFRIFKAAPNI